MLIGPKFKIARRLGSRVFPKTQTTKFSISGSPQNKKTGGGRRPKALSEYGRQLLEKQKARYTYLLKERQFATYVGKIKKGGQQKQKQEEPAALLYQQLESRLDNVVFRLGLAPSRAAARQMVSHGHIVVNGRRLNIPSHELAVGDRVAIRPESRNLGIAQRAKAAGAEGGESEAPKLAVPSWLVWEPVSGEGKVLGRPIFGAAEGEIDFGAILEFYSRV